MKLKNILYLQGSIKIFKWESCYNCCLVDNKCAALEEVRLTVSQFYWKLLNSYAISPLCTFVKFSSFYISSPSSYFSFYLLHSLLVDLLGFVKVRVLHHKRSKIAFDSRKKSLRKGNNKYKHSIFKAFSKTWYL